MIAATGLGTGYSPIAPGTVGSVLACAIYWFVLSSMGHITYLVTTIAFVFLSAWIANIAERAIGEHDPTKIVIDEIAGMFIAMALHPPLLKYLAIGFVLFRIFDILKPFPARMIDRRVRGGWGIVLDDVVAGIYANAALWIIGPFLN